MKSGVVIVADLGPQVLASIRDLVKHEVLVGIPEAKGPRQDDAAINNAALGYIHENGAPEANIPARAFLVPGIKSEQSAIGARFKAAGRAALQGDASGVDKALHAAGLIAQAAVWRKITDGPFEPLAQRTIEARLRRGRTGVKPLLDTGQLRNAISYVVVRKT